MKFKGLYIMHIRFNLLECAVYTQQNVISCNLLQLVNKRHVSASQDHHQAYKDGFN